MKRIFRRRIHYWGVASIAALACDHSAELPLRFNGINFGEDGKRSGWSADPSLNGATCGGAANEAHLSEADSLLRSGKHCCACLLGVNREALPVCKGGVAMRGDW